MKFMIIKRKFLELYSTVEIESETYYRIEYLEYDFNTNKFKRTNLEWAFNGRVYGSTKSNQLENNYKLLELSEKRNSILLQLLEK